MNGSPRGPPAVNPPTILASALTTLVVLYGIDLKVGATLKLGEPLVGGPTRPAGRQSREDSDHLDS